jgi:hypothetical protein
VRGSSDIPAASVTSTRGRNISLKCHDHYMPRAARGSDAKQAALTGGFDGKNSGKSGKQRGFSPHGARKHGAAGGCLRTGFTRRQVRHLTGTGNRHPGLRAGAMRRTAPGGAIQMGWLAAPRRQRQKHVALVWSIYFPITLRGPRLVKIVSSHPIDRSRPTQFCPRYLVRMESPPFSV